MSLGRPNSRALRAVLASHRNRRYRTSRWASEPRSSAIVTRHFGSRFLQTDCCTLYGGRSNIGQVGLSPSSALAAARVEADNAGAYLIQAGLIKSDVGWANCPNCADAHAEPAEPEAAMMSATTRNATRRGKTPDRLETPALAKRRGRCRSNELFSKATPGPPSLTRRSLQTSVLLSTVVYTAKVCNKAASTGFAPVLSSRPRRWLAQCQVTWAVLGTLREPSRCRTRGANTGDLKLDRRNIAGTERDVAVGRFAKCTEEARPAPIP